MTLYGLPYFLEDKTGSLLGSEFIDLHDRMHLIYRCTANNSAYTAFMIYQRPDTHQNSYLKPLITLIFESNHNLGTISFSERDNIEMKKFLVKVPCDNASRKFTASDGQQYTWSRGPQDGREWTCTNSSGYLVAYYSMQTPGEPQYEDSSGCTLTIDEAFGHLASEMLATLMIMRHISRYNL